MCVCEGENIKNSDAFSIYSSKQNDLCKKILKEYEKKHLVD